MSSMEPPQPQLRTSEPPHYSIGRYNHRSHLGEGGGPLEMTKEASLMDGEESSATEERRGGGDMHRSALDRNLASLRDHVKLEGFNNGVFSDVVLKAMGSTYHLHRLLLSRSSYFRNMLQGPWKEASSPVLILHVDDKNVNSEAMEMALAYLYGYYPKLNDENAFRVLAAASFLDLQDLCAICTDFIIAELWSSNFLTFQVFAESQDYGSHGERVRNACWGYLCQSGSKELKEVLPKLSSQTLHALLTSDALWVPSEEKRLELAVYSVLAKGTLGKAEKNEQVGSSCEVAASTYSGSSKVSKSTDGGGNDSMDTEQGLSKIKNNLESRNTAHNDLVELANHIVDSLSDVSTFDQAQTEYGESNLESGYNCNTRGPSTSNTFYAEDSNALCSYINIQNCIGMSVSAGSGLALEGPSDEDPCYQLNSGWPPGDQMHCVSINASCNVLMPNEWERCNVSPLTWGGRTVGRREVKSSLNQQCGMSQEDYDSFVNIFEGGSLLYCNMSFEALLDARKHLEEMGFPCKAVNDGLWLQMLLNQRVQEIGANTCTNCCRVGVACACRESFGYNASGYCIQDEHSSLSHDIGHAYINHPVQGERTGHFRPVRVHDRAPIDGLAGIGRGATFVTAAAWPPTRYVFSRVPFGIGNRGNQPPPAHDDPENRGGNNGDFAGDGLTALVGLSQGSSDTANVHEVQIRREYEMGPQGRLVGSLAPSSSAGSGIPVQIMDSAGDGMGIAWENSNSSISLDMKTPLNHFPPFRFAVEFQDVHRLCDGQVKHSPEAFYAGSLWKISVQAFSDEDPQGRRTLGLFLHRRKAEISDPHRKVHTYVDSREKVTARYQLICPSKREVMVFGSYKQSGTLLPKAPKGWGWRTALLFDELDDLLQNGALRIAAVVQLI